MRNFSYVVNVIQSHSRATRSRLKFLNVSDCYVFCHLLCDPSKSTFAILFARVEVGYWLCHFIAYTAVLCHLQFTMLSIIYCMCSWKHLEISVLGLIMLRCEVPPLTLLSRCAKTRLIDEILGSLQSYSLCWCLFWSLMCTSVFNSSEYIAVLRFRSLHGERKKSFSADFMSVSE